MPQGPISSHKDLNLAGVSCGTKETDRMSKSLPLLPLRPVPDLSPIWCPTSGNKDRFKCRSRSSLPLTLALHCRLVRLKSVVFSLQRTECLTTVTPFESPCTNASWAPFNLCGYSMVCFPVPSPALHLKVIATGLWGWLSE